MAEAAVTEVFSVLATDGAARAGVLRTARGAIESPVFMPVGT
jgi:queuine tRNA-ribosyltransferase